MKVVIIGGVAAGMSTAAKLKRNLQDKVDIMVFEKGVDISYGACGIPFYISDHIKNSNDLIAKTPQHFIERGINIKIRHEVTNVDTNKKLVTVKDLDGNTEFTESYDKLIIASGARVNKFPPFNQQLNNLYEVRDVNDGTTIKAEIQKDSVKNILIVGAGFIGLELVEACHKYGKNVIVIERGPKILSPMDDEISSKLKEELESNKVDIRINTSVVDLVIDNNIATKAILECNGGKEEISIDMVINCAGIVPNTDFISDIEKFKNGAIIVNEKMQTSITDIYAAGDCSIMKSFTTGLLAYAPLGTNANKQGRIIAAILSDKTPQPFKLIGSSAIRLFGLDAAKVGLSEEDAKRLNLDYKVNLITGNSYASYYGTEKVTVKVVYEATTRKILGAQVIGQGIVVPRANYYAIAIYSELTVDEFGFMDLCYSPPFSGVWDVSLIASNSAK